MPSYDVLLQGCSEIGYSDEVSSADLETDAVRRSLGDDYEDEYIVENMAKVV